MIRKLLLAFVALAYVGGVCAQTLDVRPWQKIAKKSSDVAKSSSFKINGKVSNAVSKSKMWVSPTSVSSASQVVSNIKRAPEDERVTTWFSYLNSENVGIVSLNTSNVTYTFASLVPPTYAGGKIDSVAIVFTSKSLMENVKIWFAPIEYDSDGLVVLPENGIDGLGEGSYCFDVDPSLINDPDIDGNSVTPYLTQLELPEEYEIPSTGCIMGYAFTYSGTTNDIAFFTYGTDEVGGGYLYEPSNGWGALYGTGYGNLTTSILVDVTGLPSSNVSMRSFTETTGRTNVQTAITGIIANDGFSPVESISYVLTLNGGTPQEEQTITFAQPIEGQSTGMANFPVTPTINGENTVTVQITKVNGVDNISTSATGSGVVLGLSNPYARTSVVEGFAGTWDGFTPIVYKGFEKLAQDFGGGGIITLAAHFYTTDGTNVYVDPMQCDDYVDVANTYGADIPIAFYDRMFTGDPYAGIEYSNDGTHYQYGATRSVQIIGANYPSEAELTLDASYANFAQTSINADVTVNFACNRLTAPYAIAFVLSEDGMTGTDNSWMQANYFSTADYSDLAQYVEAYNVPDMQDWFNAAGSVATTYDDVIVAAWQPVSGYSNSISAPILVGVPKQFSQTLDISANTLIQNKNNLELTALLINTNTGGIVNAVQVPLGTGTGIEGVENAGSDAVEVARYNVNGVLLDAPQKGLNIIKYSDGSVKKVMVK